MMEEAEKDLRRDHRREICFPYDFRKGVTIILPCSDSHIPKHIHTHICKSYILHESCTLGAVSHQSSHPVCVEELGLKSFCSVLLITSSSPYLSTPDKMHVCECCVGVCVLLHGTAGSVMLLPCHAMHADVNTPLTPVSHPVSSQ